MGMNSSCEEVKCKKEGYGKLIPIKRLIAKPNGEGELVWCRGVVVTKIVVICL